MPGISFEVDEARSWFARTGRSFDLLQMSLIDTWAATGAGAFTLSENGLYTVEAWRIFLERLTPDGVFTVSRWYAPGEVNETGRMMSLAVATLQDLGAVEPKRHLFVAASETVATLVMSRKPLSAPALAALAGGRRDLRFPRSPQPRDRGGLAAPAGHRCGDRSPRSRAGRPKLPSRSQPADRCAPVLLQPVAACSPSRRGRLHARLTPRRVRRQSARHPDACDPDPRLGDPRGGTIVAPLRSTVAAAGAPLALGGTAYFGLIGMGFMMAEIALLQRMSVFLGHPVYALSIVLFSLILSTGLGSLASERFALDRGSRLLGWAMLTGLYLVLLPSWAPGIAQIL